jgi:hypothetical protein
MPLSVNFSEAGFKERTAMGKKLKRFGFCFEPAD